MKFHSPLIAISLIANLPAAEVPKIFAGLLEPNIPANGQIGVVQPPPEFEKYDVKVSAAARKDQKWFREFFSKTKPGDPLPFDERLGLTKEEYADYLVLWAKRDFATLQNVVLLLRQSSGNSWVITGDKGASLLTTIRYIPKEDVFRSPNGDLKRVDDIKAEASGLLVAWSGQEWKFEEETGIGKTSESLALGRFSDNKYGIIVYHVQEVTTEGTRLLDKSLILRFALGKGGHAKMPDPKLSAKDPDSDSEGDLKQPDPGKTNPAPAKPAKSGKSTKPATKK